MMTKNLIGNSIAFTIYLLACLPHLSHAGFLGKLIAESAEHSIEKNAALAAEHSIVKSAALNTDRIILKNYASEFNVKCLSDHPQETKKSNDASKACTEKSTAYLECLNQNAKSESTLEEAKAFCEKTDLSKYQTETSGWSVFGWFLVFCFGVWLLYALTSTFFTVLTWLIRAITRIFVTKN